MRKIAVLILLFFFCPRLHAQGIIFKDVAEISRQEYRRHIGHPIFCESLQLKNGHKIIIKTPARTIVLKDDGEMKQYHYGCEVPGTALFLIHELEPNTEEYYLINRQKGTIDTLVGYPVFYPDSKMAVCLEGIATDQTQRIQVGEIRNGRFRTKFFFELKAEIRPGYVFWFDKHTLYLNDNDEKFYKLIF